MSSTARKRRLELVQAIKKHIEGKGKIPTINYQKLLNELKDNSNVVSIFFIFIRVTKLQIVSIKHSHFCFFYR